MGKCRGGSVTHSPILAANEEVQELYRCSQPSLVDEVGAGNSIDAYSPLLMAVRGCRSGIATHSPILRTHGWWYPTGISTLTVDPTDILLISNGCITGGSNGCLGGGTQRIHWRGSNG